MPIHDWTRVDAGTFHDFHHSWVEEIKRALNRGVLPSGYYAKAEQIAGGLSPDVVTLQRPGGSQTGHPTMGGLVTLESAPPKVQFRARIEAQSYANKAKGVAVRHRSSHEVIAVIEVVSPGNKNSRHGINAFLKKTEELLNAGVHLVILDLFPPGPRDPQGLHPLIWGDDSTPYVPPADKPLSLMAYLAGLCREAFVEPVAVGDALVDMPLFLTERDYVPLPLEATYQAAWDALPSISQEELTQPPG